MRNKFDKQLDKMNGMLEEMGELCAQAIYNASKALKDRESGIAKVIVDEDEEIDHMEKEVERLCLKLLLQQQPVAKDLRQISSALKMITDMERIGDQAADIARIILKSEITDHREIAKIQEMADKTSKMVKNSITAFINKDLEMTKKVIESDEQVNILFKEIKNSLVELIVKSKEHSSEAIDLIMIAKYLERIGDHATNIAEWVEFSITGVHHIKEV